MMADRGINDAYTERIRNAVAEVLAVTPRAVWIEQVRLRLDIHWSFSSRLVCWLN